MTATRHTRLVPVGFAVLAVLALASLFREPETASATAPSCPAGSATVVEDSGSNPFTIAGGCSDPDLGQTVSCALDTGPLNGTATVDSTCYLVAVTGTYTPAANYCGSDSFKYKGTDSSGPSSFVIATVSVTVTCTPDAPSCPDFSTSVGEDSGTTTIALLGCTDPDPSQSVSCAITTPALNGTATINSGCTSATYTPNANFCSAVADSFVYTGTDNDTIPLIDTGTVSVTVTCAPDAPSCPAGSATVVEDSGSNPFTIAGGCSDPDLGQTVSCALDTGPLNGTATVDSTCYLVAVTGTYTPAANYCLSDSFNYKGTDSSGPSSFVIATVSVTVTCTPDAPSCPDFSTSVAEDSVANTITLPGCTDPDVGQVVTCLLGTPPANGVATVSPLCTSATYTPTPNFCGSDPFTYTGTDTGIPPSSDPGTVSVTVTCLSDSPSCPDAMASVASNSTANPIVLPGCTDPDTGQVVTCALGAPPTHGSATAGPPCIAATYTPTTDYCGNDSFSYIGTDSGVPPSSGSGLVTIRISCGDKDGDGVNDFDEDNCGGDSANPAIRPERLDTGGDDDGDTIINEALPPGSSDFDCDGDGWKGAQENRVYNDLSAFTAHDQDPCGNNGWPADLDPDNKLNIGDINSFTTLARPNPDHPYSDGHGNFNKFGHTLDDAPPTDGVIDPLMARWNLDTPPHLTTTAIDIGDLNAINPGVAANSSRPPMFGGLPAFFTSGGTCPWPP